ncbi:MAG TPA: hypothetical protein VKE41_06355 [Roseiflexaceae bacterium]|nr:hypothetical protein [Roseiflexaceae bacterium]
MMTNQYADLSGWYWHPGAEQPVYVFWRDARWWARWYEPPESDGGMLDERLTPGLLHDLIPLGAARRERQVGA